ncbi:Rhamnolipids biosynthesis 3-oxoacyl-[acyl-carrier-protein] reductase [Lachnellula suecica]|uniref:Rhamnolipids biosynthesis 3-oxoacyl-[acyl-carrier-protein] reductase n=1 Tax=Lachnellula suecica TaxID=602035 RepID=A0A8T9CMM1_9HELO|nr:Rhamnolipids biosynthesis 3-oxoacyl-[acyl-carrier-protein] reductase [Lachnellula suecica]
MARLLSQNMFDVNGRTVLIMGGGSGIGRMLAKGFSVNGANTVFVDIDENFLLEAKKEAEDLAKTVGVDAKVHTIKGDLSSKEGVQAVIANFLQTHATLDTIIHRAAYRHMNVIPFKHGESLETLQTATSSASWDLWSHAFQLNVLAPYFLTAGLITLLGDAARKGDGRGSVILFSSPASVHNHQFVPAYQTSKAAVDHLTRIIAAEFADFYRAYTYLSLLFSMIVELTYVVRVNAISPGIVPSGMSDVNDPASNLHLAKESPARRAGGEDMAGTAIWLSSKAGSFMDGEIVRIDGGRLLVLKGVISHHD